MKPDEALQINTASLNDGHVRLESLTELDVELIFSIYSDAIAAESTLLRPALKHWKKRPNILRSFFRRRPLRFIVKPVWSQLVLLA
jgi:hypothetical protein